MKKFAALLLVICLLFCACYRAPRTPMETVQTEAGTEPTQSAVTGQENETAYLAIQRSPAKGYESKYYGFENDMTLIRITHPSEWRVIPGYEGTYYILQDNRVIGEMIGDYVANETRWTDRVSRSFDVDGGSVSMHLEATRGNDGTFAYRYRYVYEYIAEAQLRVVTVTLECASVDSVTEEKLLLDTRFLPNETSATAGLLSHIPTPQSILILGNSFVNSSNIGAILEEMLWNNRKNVEVTAVSRGMATVQSYASDSQMLASLESGTYDIVFLCGFYSSDAANKLSVFVSACEQSGTTLVIFPAHNESVDVVQSAAIRHKSVYLLDWKAELDRLISTGVSRWDLCVDDAYDHSNPLAGYVGAHLIYRSIYGVSPTIPMQSSIQQSEINRILGNYAYNGDTLPLDINKITYFSQ